MRIKTNLTIFLSLMFAWDVRAPMGLLALPIVRVAVRSPEHGLFAEAELACYDIDDGFKSFNSDN